MNNLYLKESQPLEFKKSNDIKDIFKFDEISIHNYAADDYDSYVCYKSGVVFSIIKYPLFLRKKYELIPLKYYKTKDIKLKHSRILKLLRLLK